MRYSSSGRVPCCLKCIGDHVRLRRQSCRSSSVALKRKSDARNVSTATSSSPHLNRQLGLWSATALVVGEVIAVGIFLTPAEMSKSIGSPLWIAIVWLGVGAMSLCGALCYGELAARFPEAGGG